MTNKILRLFRKSYHNLNTIEVSKENLLKNYKYLSSLEKGVKPAPVLKSNGYGHGITLIGKILDKVNAPFFCVDSLYEAYQLYKDKIKTPILIMGSTDSENLKVKKLPFSWAVYDLDFLKAIDKYQPNAGVHIFVDTGMGREGLLLNELPLFLEELKKLPNIKVEGLMSHFASADNNKDLLNKKQIDNFRRATEILKKHNIHPKWIHLQNSDAFTNLKSVGINASMARTGLAVYGISKDSNLKPILTLKSKIIQIKNLKAGERVGYSGTYKSKKDMVLGILPIGYYDGVDRNLSNKGFVKVDGIFCKILGRVSMNIMTIDLTQIKNPKIGDEVIIYSNSPKDKNSIENVAKICKKIPYEILVHLVSSTKRIVV